MKYNIEVFLVVCAFQVISGQIAEELGKMMLKSINDTIFLQIDLHLQFLNRNMGFNDKSFDEYHRVEFQSQDLPKELQELASSLNNDDVDTSDCVKSAQDNATIILNEQKDALYSLNMDKSKKVDEVLGNITSIPAELSNLYRTVNASIEKCNADFSGDGLYDCVIGIAAEFNDAISDIITNIGLQFKQAQSVFGELEGKLNKLIADNINYNVMQCARDALTSCIQNLSNSN